LKYVCAQTCGISFQECFDTFWECAERACDKFQQDHRNCLDEAGWNDMRFLLKERREKLVMLNMPKDADICTAFHGLQRGSCDCVPQAEWESKLKARFEDHFREHHPDKVTKKGTFKDKKFWKAWKGKRAELFFKMVMQSKDKLVKNTDFSAEDEQKQMEEHVKNVKRAQEAGEL